MTLDPSVFDSFTPTEKQMKLMATCRAAAKAYAAILEESMPSGPDKTYVMRKVLENAMWVNFSITRHPGGARRD